MSLPKRLLDIENRSIGPDGERCIGFALELALVEWRSGNKDRELALHLLFLAWYCNIEPEFLTGIEQTSLANTSLADIFQEVYESVAVNISTDAEALYVVGLMAHISPWLLGEDATTWEARSRDFQKRYRSLLPDGISADRFKGRGAYGDYFAGQAAVEGGY